MCGRYLFDPEVEQARIILNYIVRRFGNKKADELSRGEIFPSSEVPILLTAESDPFKSYEEKRKIARHDYAGNEELIALPMTWGVPVKFSSKLVINARQETVDEKVTFIDAFKNQRCVVPTTGFIEWSHDNKGKTMDKFALKSDFSPMLFLAAIYFVIDGVMRFVILTRAANPSMVDIHNRQPLILKSEMIRPWISDINAANYLRQQEGPNLMREIID